MIIDSKTRLLVISPHPDDEALGCGGLIGKCKKEKAEVSVLYISIGNSRQLVTKQTKKDVRRKEVEQVESFAKITTQIVYDGEEFCRLDALPQKELVEKIEDAIEKYKPTLVAIPSRVSYNQDHRAVWTACMTALRPTPKNVRHIVPNVLEYYEPYIWAVGNSVEPNVFLPLDELYKGKTLLDFKIALYKCHKTQVRKDPFPRSVENVKHWAHWIGKEIGEFTAEGYYLLRETL